MAVADILIFSGWPKSHESQGTGSITNKFVSYLVKSDIIGRAAAPWPPDVCHCAGDGRGTCPLCFPPWRAGGARIALHIELFPPLLPCKGALFGVVNSLTEENFSGENPQTLSLPCYSYETNGLSIVEFEDQNLPLQKSIHIHRFAHRERLTPCLS